MMKKQYNILILLILIFFISSLAGPETHADLEGPRSGLVGWWKLDEGEGSIVRDSSGNGNNGIAIGSPTWTTGPAGVALSFNGTTDYIRIPFCRLMVQPTISEFHSINR
jgi:hypothetical protein